ncbi:MULTISPECIES: YgaP family membrane protein [Acidithiobacillus]|jgi:hypothetical protein|uniref:Inner membrane protein YgaP-like transmembrane domain-containing protein n=3 Tax=root TaxID=1 RepID=B7J6D0_ACIF2|nr:MULTISPECIES: DUF2892 domain-containing protein [Acidithiobacillus]MCL5957561.1 DUF2892 domain-containing protein [Gammaproteobacteria bacterium]ACH84215.1 conserved hypothetical protein [Acidithiobacillus ferrooxidans ATCC 53993]ACK79412.1 conserved hypothetical protein [Acidithiobacillus ferrooxidans ATCC 23270]MBN6743599.1 DUF2892 domain-containing protein [Acidithiobacillus sp. MC2.2]MBN6747539.1 DUF2892 domain-containing protein [Acidithiobacillus sp. PG05]
MNTERWVRVVAGFFVLLSVALGAPGSPVFVSEWFLVVTLFVGFNLLQSGFTCFCPLDRILLKFGVPGSGACGR